MKSDYPVEKQVPALRELWKTAFGDDDDFLDGFFSTAFAFDRCRCIPTEEGVAAAVYWMDCTCRDRKLAYIYALAVHPDYRGRGIAKYLMGDVHQLLLNRGYDGVLLVPGDDGLREMYRYMGYTDCTTIREFVCGSESGIVDIHPVTLEDYTRLRRISVPEGAVLQEGVSLEFLQKDAQFYAGSGFLLCAVPHGDDLRGIELLGNIALAPRILCTLGCAHGTFRTPGDQLPFAMLHPLTPDCPRPSYFGLAFD